MKGSPQQQHNLCINISYEGVNIRISLGNSVIYCEMNTSCYPVIGRVEPSLLAIYEVTKYLTEAPADEESLQAAEEGISRATIKLNGT